MTSTSAIRSQVVVCGLGGQGILFLTRVLGEAALTEGREVLTAEARGMAQRGGTVDSHVKTGDFAGPLVRAGRADAALALDPARIEDAKAFAGATGLCFAAAAPPVEGVRALDAAAAAKRAGCEGAANLVLLGYAAAVAPHLFPSPAAIHEALDRLSGTARREDNARAFEAGRSLA